MEELLRELLPVLAIVAAYVRWLIWVYLEATEED